MDTLSPRIAASYNSLDNLDHDFKFRLLAMLSSLIGGACVIAAIIRLYLAYKKREDEWSSDGDTLMDLAVGARVIDFLFACLLFSSDVCFIELTYPVTSSVIPLSDPLAQLKTATSFLLLLALNVEPSLLVLTIYHLAIQWFKIPKWVLPTVLTLFCVVPLIAMSVRASTVDYVTLQVTAMITSTVFNLFLLMIFRILLYWLTSHYPIIAYNEVNAGVVKLKVLSIVLAVVLDASILLIFQFSDATVVLKLVSLGLIHIRAVTAIGLSVDIAQLQRPVYFDVTTMLTGVVPPEPSLRKRSIFDITPDVSITDTAQLTPEPSTDDYSEILHGNNESGILASIGGSTPSILDHPKERRLSTRESFNSSNSSIPAAKSAGQELLESSKQKESEIKTKLTQLLEDLDSEEDAPPSLPSLPSRSTMSAVSARSFPSSTSSIGIPEGPMKRVQSLKMEDEINQKLNLMLAKLDIDEEALSVSMNSKVTSNPLESSVNTTGKNSFGFNQSRNLAMDSNQKKIEPHTPPSVFQSYEQSLRSNASIANENKSADNADPKPVMVLHSEPQVDLSGNST
jgi:hypothetical protein